MCSGELAELLRMDLVAGRARNQGAWRQIRHELAALKINTPSGSMQAARQRQLRRQGMGVY